MKLKKCQNELRNTTTSTVAHEETRSLDANAKMWAMLADVSRQVPWPVMFEGRMDVVKMDSESWKNVFTASLEKTQRMAQGIDGGYVLLGTRTRKMSKKKMAELIDLIQYFGDSKGVKWTPDKRTIAQYEQFSGVI